METTLDPVLEAVLAPLRGAGIPDEALPATVSAFLDGTAWHTWAACPAGSSTDPFLSSVPLTGTDVKPCGACVGPGGRKDLPSELKRLGVFTEKTLSAIRTGMPAADELREVRACLRGLSGLVFPDALEAWGRERLAELRARRDELKAGADLTEAARLLWKEVAGANGFVDEAIGVLAPRDVGDYPEEGSLEQVLGEHNLEEFVETWAHYGSERRDALRTSLAAADFISNRSEDLMVSQLPDELPVREPHEHVSAWLERAWRASVEAAYEAAEPVLVDLVDTLVAQDLEWVLLADAGARRQWRELDPLAPELDDGRVLLRLPKVVIPHWSGAEVACRTPVLEGACAGQVLETAAVIAAGGPITRDVLASAANLEA